jgi:hypothetical protein
MAAIHGRHPAGALRASKFVPDEFVNLCGMFQFLSDQT